MLTAGNMPSSLETIEVESSVRDHMEDAIMGNSPLATQAAIPPHQDTKTNTEKKSTSKQVRSKQRISNACLRCRQSRIKCDGNTPCRSCARKGRDCQRSATQSKKPAPTNTMATRRRTKVPNPTSNPPSVSCHIRMHDQDMIDSHNSSTAPAVMAPSKDLNAVAEDTNAIAVHSPISQRRSALVTESLEADMVDVQTFAAERLLEPLDLEPEDWNVNSLIEDGDFIWSPLVETDWSRNLSNSQINCSLNQESLTTVGSTIALSDLPSDLPIPTPCQNQPIVDAIQEAQTQLHNAVEELNSVNESYMNDLRRAFAASESRAARLSKDLATLKTEHEHLQKQLEQFSRTESNLRHNLRTTNQDLERARTELNSARVGQKALVERDRELKLTRNELIQLQAQHAILIKKLQRPDMCLTYMKKPG